MPESRTNRDLQTIAGETNIPSAEAVHQEAKLAFETSCQNFDKAIGIENAWHNLDNWWDSPRYSGGLYGGDERAKRQNAAVVDINAAFRSLQTAFNNLDETSRERLFEMTASFSSSTGKESFEFDLPQIMRGRQAGQRLQTFRFDEAETWDAETQQAYGQAAWEHETLYQNSILRAAEFIFGEERRVDISRMRKPGNEQRAAVWQRMDEMGQELGEIFLTALNNGHQAAILRMYEWLYNFNVNLFNPSNEPVKGKYRVDGMNTVTYPMPEKYRFQFAFFLLGKHLINRDNNAQEIMNHKNSM